MEARGFVASPSDLRACRSSSSTRWRAVRGLPTTVVKSVTGDTPIVVMETAVAKYVLIGD
jgi:hypothetical protein